LNISRIGEIIFFNFCNEDIPRLGIIISQQNQENTYIVTQIIERQENSEFMIQLNRTDIESDSIDYNNHNTIYVNKILSINKENILQDNIGKLKNEKVKMMLDLWAKLLAKSYYQAVHYPVQTKSFIPEKTYINYAGRVFDEQELINLVDSSLEFWLTYGKYSKAFEKKLADFLKVRYAFLVNSGSSANLLAFMTLTSPQLKERRIQRGDEVIAVAAGFPTTISPIIQYGAVPVFVDVDLETANINILQLEKALSSKTKAIMLAHTLGNPFNLEFITNFCKKHNLWLIEDNCDALGSLYKGKYTGTWGDIGTSSFYPPHHITMGEGGAVYTNKPELKRIILSIRDWGRDCWCDSGKDNTCGKRFSEQFGTLPIGYDHKYVYSHFGYNLKVTDMQAAIGCAQLDKLPDFIEKRKQNFSLFYDGLKELEDYFILPKATKHSEPSWFGFLITLKNNVSFSRNDLVTYLESKQVQTRNLFAGNILRQPAFADLQKDVDYRVIDNLKNTDKLMNDSFWVGVYPAMKQEAIEYIVEQIRYYCNNINLL